MKNYIPFLKTKLNEFSAIKNLETNVSENITPFFDINRKANKKELDGNKQFSVSQKYTEQEYKDKISKLIRKFEINLANINKFYLDDSEIDNALFVDGKQSYEFVIDKFTNFLFIPVIGIDRSPLRNNVVFTNKQFIQSDTVAIRIIYEDLQTGIMDIMNLFVEAQKYFTNVELIIDFKIIRKDINFSVILSTLEKLIQKISGFSKIIITASSIPKSISESVSTKEEKNIPRTELDLYSFLNSSVSGICFGDYTIISPYYSDVDMPPEMLLNITAAKIIYSYENYHHVYRGEVLQSGDYEQYKNFCDALSKESYFRGNLYSYGDNFIASAKTKIGKITQSSILAPTINAHISYMYKDYQL